MGIAFSLFLIAVGAVMRFAVTVQSSSFNVHTVGVILLIVGIVGAVLSILFWSSWGGVKRRKVVTTSGGDGAPPVTRYEEERQTGI